MPVITEKPSRVFNGMKLYNTDKIAKILEMSVHTIRRYFREGKFPKVRISGSYYVSEENLIKFLTTGRTVDEVQAISEKIIKKTEENLEAISKISKYYKDIVAYIEKTGHMSENFLVFRREQKKYENKLNKAKKEYEEYKRENIMDKD